MARELIPGLEVGLGAVTLKCLSIRLGGTKLYCVVPVLVRLNILRLQPQRDAATLFGIEREGHASDAGQRVAVDIS